jgi:hypothetical protein
MSLQNRFKKGAASPNPGGRPKGAFSLKHALDVKLSDVNTKDMHRRTYGQCLIDRALDIAVKGGRATNMQVRVIADILDRALGKPVQALAVADMRPESREQLITNILEHARAERESENENDGPATIQ